MPSTHTLAPTPTPTHLLQRPLSPSISPSSPSHSPTPPSMPSSRSSNTLPGPRPTSPLSPRFDAASRFESLQPSSTRTMHRTPANPSRRPTSNSLKLPSLPRFHPANYPSAHSSATSTPDGNTTSPQPPMSPRAHQRVISEAQKHLLMYQRETVSAARASSPAHMEKPISPRLAPLGSPGPVTPLELECSDGYLSAGARHMVGQEGMTSEDLVERLIREETSQQRRRTASSSPSRNAGR